jgi:hypothetical protein
MQGDKPRVERNYCQQCYEKRKEKSECKLCGRVVAFEDYPTHNSDYHEAYP